MNNPSFSGSNVTVTVSSTWGFVDRPRPRDRRRGAVLLGSSTGPKPLIVGRVVPPKLLCSLGPEPLRLLFPHPDPELLGGAVSGWPLELSRWTSLLCVISVVTLLDQAFVVERTLPKPFNIGCSAAAAAWL